MTEEEKTLFMDWKIKNKDNIENVVINFLNYEKGVDTKTCYDELEYLLKKAFKAGKDMDVSTKWHDLQKNHTTSYKKIGV